MIVVDQFGQRVVFMPHTGDIIYDSAIGDPAVDQEDVLVIGHWQETGLRTGSDFDVTTKSVMTIPPPNELQGTLGGLRGADVANLTDRGKTKLVHRQRQVKRYLKTSGK